MSTEQTESTQQPGPAGPAGPADGPPPAEWGAPPPPAAQKSRWTAKRTIIAVVVAVGIAAAGGAAIYFASGTVDNSAGPGGGRAGGPMMVGGPMGGMDGTQHGEFQTGDITAISDDSVTVKSEDGYEQTYVITSDTQKTDDLAKGDRVTVVSTTENDKPTARSLMEFGAFGGPGGGRRNGPANGEPPGNFDSNGK
jgi:hypothetical protein